MANKTTIVEIATLANVGIGTVSRVINNHPSVSAKTREKVMTVINETAYVPVDSARDLKRESLKAIAVIINGLSNTFFGSMIPILQNELEQNNYAMLMHQLDENEDSVGAAIRICKEKKPRGVIFMGGHFQDKTKDLALINVPYVMLTTTLREGIDRHSFSSVTIDDFQAGYETGLKVVGGKHKKIGVIAGNLDPKSISQLRVAGFSKALEDNGITLDAATIAYAGGYTHAAGYACAKTLISKGTYTCLFCVSDIIALGAIRALFEANLNVPNDVSVIGFDGLVEGRYSIPSLTTIKQPSKEMAEKSVKTLLQHLNTGRAHKHYVFEPTFVEGESFMQLGEQTVV